MARQRKRRLTAALVWDGFMVYLAILNVLGIVFDFTYFWFRPFYVNQVGWVAGIYDRVKGVEPHPFTDRYLTLVDEARELLDRPERQDELAARLDELRRLSVRMLDEDPFGSSRRRDALDAIRFWVVREVGQPITAAAERASVERAFQRFWNLEPEALPSRLAMFDDKIRPIMAANYFREYDPDSGKFRDHAWLIDLPFLLIFATEFFVRWGIAVRRRTYRLWYLFPAFNWYDALGLIPYFRLFRLFRIVSIYLRLHRSEMTSIGQDAISRTVKFVARAITEEITDMVTLRILEQTQERVRKGVYTDVVEDELAARGESIRETLVDTMREVVDSEELRERAREFMRLNLDQSVASAPALRGIPLPDSVLRRLVGGIGNAIFDSFVRTVSDTLEEERGREALEQIVDQVLGKFLADFTRGDLEEMIQRITLEMVERTKRTVAAKEWAGEKVSKEDLSRLDP